MTDKELLQMTDDELLRLPEVREKCRDCKHRKLCARLAYKQGFEFDLDSHEECIDLFSPRFWVRVREWFKRLRQGR